MLTNQQVTYLFYGAADVLGVPGGWTFIERAGWEWLADDPEAEFDTAHLDARPSGLSQAEWDYLSAQIRQALGGDAAPIVEVESDALAEQPSDEGPPAETDDLAGPPPTPSLLGPAFALPYSTADAEKAYAAQPAVSKVIRHWPEVLRLAREVPSATHIYRHWDRWGTTFPYPLSEPVARLVEEWIEEVEPERRLAEFVGAGGRRLLFEGFHEPDINDPDLLAAYTEFEARRVEALARVGCLACIGQFGVGAPNADNMAAFLPAIEALNDAVVDGQTGCLGVHEYGTVWPWAWMGRNQGAELNADPFPDVSDPARTWPAHLIGRFQGYYAAVFEPAGYGDTPLILTETGLGPVIDSRVLRYVAPDSDYPHGYRTCFFLWDRLFDFEGSERGFGPGALTEDGRAIRDHEAFYVELLKWVDDFLRQFSFVKGALPFLTGGYAEWESFNIQGSAMTKFMDYVASENVAVPA